MRKINYREVSSELEKMASPNFLKSGRSSVGMEEFIGEYFYLDVNKLIPFKNQARKIFNDSEIEELAETIKSVGIQQPLIVLKSDNDSFEVISGERRLRAAKLVGLKKVPCIITDKIEQAEEIALIENIQRSDLHPIEFGESLKSLLARSGWGDISKLAKKLGKTQPYISENLAYSKLPEVIKKYLIKYNIRTRDTLRKLVKCDSLEDMEAILGIKTTEKKQHSRSILRINLKANEFLIQDKAILKLDNNQRLQLKEMLARLIKNIENLHD